MVVEVINLCTIILDIIRMEKEEEEEEEEVHIPASAAKKKSSSGINARVIRR